MSAAVYARGVLFDFNGTLFFDSLFHQEAWRRIYQELYKGTKEVPGDSFFRGPRNEIFVKVIRNNCIWWRGWKMCLGY